MPSDLDRTLRALTINVSGPSLARAELLVDALAGIDVDVLVLTETRDNAGTRLLLDSYVRRGWTVIAPTPPVTGERGVALVHRLGGDLPIDVPHVDLHHRLVVSRVALREPVVLVGVYVPSRDVSAAKILRKQRFLDQLKCVLTSLRGEDHVVVLGDLNVISRSHEPRYSSFRSWEYDVLDGFAEIGLVDAFDRLHPGVQPHSWIGRKGAGYRYDYGFVSEALGAGLLSCDYQHELRLAGLTDHAAVSLSLHVPALVGAGVASIEG